MKEVSYKEQRASNERRKSHCDVATLDRRATPERRVTAHFHLDVALATAVINRISEDSKKAAMGESLAGYLMRNNLLGALWSPQHLACIFYRFEHYTGIRQSATGASRLFNTLHRAALKEYKTLSFDGIEISDRAQFLAHLDDKIAAKYGPHFQARVKSHGLIADVDHCKFIENQWHYLQARRGQDLPM